MIRSVASAAAMLGLLLASGRAAADQPTPEPAQQPHVLDATAPLTLRCSMCFVDRSGRVVRFEPTYDAWFAGARAEPRYWMAGAEMAAILTLGTIYYWVRPGINRPDWDFPDAFTRMANLEATLDNNEFGTNHVLHAASGATYYLFARENDLNPFISLAYSAGSSAVFEFFLEWLEKVSLNDLVFTPAAGVPAGEFVFQLGEYLNSAPRPTTGSRIAAWTLGAPSAFHDGPRGLRSRARLPGDNLGLSSAWWHRFRISYGLAQAQAERGTDETYHRVRLEAELNAMPGMLRPGHFSTGFGQANFNDMRIAYGVNGRGMIESDVWFHTILAGQYTQSFEQRPSGLRGEAAIVGLSMAWRYNDRQPVGRRDQFAMAHLFGPVAETLFAVGGVLARVRADVHLDFGGVRSLPFSDRPAVYDPETMKSVLQNYGYAFVAGASGRFTASLEYGPFELGVRRAYGQYDSLQGYDRLQSEVENDTPSDDSVSELEGWLAAKPPTVPLELRLDYHRIFRFSRMHPLREHRTDRMLAASIGARF